MLVVMILLIGEVMVRLLVMGLLCGVVWQVMQLEVIVRQWLCLISVVLGEMVGVGVVVGILGGVFVGLGVCVIVDVVSRVVVRVRRFNGCMFVFRFFVVGV